LKTALPACYNGVEPWEDKATQECDLSAHVFDRRQGRERQTPFPANSFIPVDGLESDKLNLYLF